MRGFRPFRRCLEPPHPRLRRDLSPPGRGDGAPCRRPHSLRQILRNSTQALPERSYDQSGLRCNETARWFLCVPTSIAALLVAGLRQVDNGPHPPPCGWSPLPVPGRDGALDPCRASSPNGIVLDLPRNDRALRRGHCRTEECGAACRGLHPSPERGGGTMRSMVGGDAGRRLTTVPESLCRTQWPPERGDGAARREGQPCARHGSNRARPPKEPCVCGRLRQAFPQPRRGKAGAIVAPAPVRSYSVGMRSIESAISGAFRISARWATKASCGKFISMPAPSWHGAVG